MPLEDDQLTHLCQGRVFDAEAARQRDGWHHQGSQPRAHYGFPRDPGLWLYKTHPVHGCGHQTLWLFTLVWLDDDSRVDHVETSAVRVHNHGAGDELEVPLAPPDHAVARRELEALLGDEARAPIILPPVDLTELLPLLGHTIYEGTFSKLTRRLRLRRIYDPFDLSDQWATPDNRLRMQDEPGHRIAAISLEPSPEDLFHGEPLRDLARYRMRKRLGPPASSAEGLTGAWAWLDTFQVDGVEVNVGYAGRHRRVRWVEMTRRGEDVIWSVE